MKETKLKESTFELWRLIGRANHSIFTHRQKELRQHHIPVPQLWVLIAIKELGATATLNEVAKAVERKPNVISLQTAIMEKDGLIKRLKNTPKSTLLKLELTRKVGRLSTLADTVNQSLKYSQLYLQASANSWNLF